MFDRKLKEIASEVYNHDGDDDVDSEVVEAVD